MDGLARWRHFSSIQESNIINEGRPRKGVSKASANDEILEEKEGGKCTSNPAEQKDGVSHKSKGHSDSGHHRYHRFLHVNGCASPVR